MISRDVDRGGCGIGVDRGDRVLVHAAYRELLASFQKLRFPGDAVFVGVDRVDDIAAGIGDFEVIPDWTVNR